MKHILTPLEKAERRLGYLLLLPAFLLLGAVVLYPVYELVRTSFTFNHLAQPWRGTPFIGFENYIRAMGDERFYEALWHTLLYIIITVPGAVLMGLGLALLANKPFTIKWPVRLGLLLPWALPLVFSGLIFRWFFEYNQGIAKAQAAFDEMGKLCTRPWVMLSAGAGMAEFRNVLAHAYAAGASGYLAGRAIWAEAFKAYPDWAAIRHGLQSEAVPYMRDINALTDKSALPFWTNWGGVTLEAADETFRHAYAGFGK